MKSSAHPVAVALILAMFSATTLGASGQVCVGPVPVATAGKKSLYNATASAVPFEFTITLGSAAPVAVSHAESSRVDGLDTLQKHLVVIRQKGKRVASFRFSFEEYKTQNLCLWFNALYESWSLWPEAISAGKCKCAN